MASSDSVDLTTAAKSIPLAQRAALLGGLRETDLHTHLKRLLEKKIPKALVEVTHGAKEYGKDVVLVDSDGLTERVAAFVVKSGKLGGKSAGVVDEILSQVKQAFTHPAKLKSFLQPKKVTQVFVVVAGTVTSNARRRIDEEVKGHVQAIWDIAYLASEFTEHYPEVFFEAATLDFLQRRITELEAHPLFLRLAEDKTLSEWFVDPFVSSAEDLEDPTGDPVPRATKTYSFVKLRQILTRKRRIVLVGEPGSGKSAIVAKLAIDMMKESFRVTTDRKGKKLGVPILITARQMRNHDTVGDLLRDQFGETSVDDFSVSALLVDALDEVRADARSLVLERAREFADELDCNLVVTTRWTEAMREPIRGFHEVQLAEFRVNQALRLFENLVNDGALLKSLREGLDLIQNQLHMTPLTLVLLIQVVREFKEIPASVTELYDRFFDYALGRHDREKGIEGLFGYQIKRKFLGEVARRAFFEEDRLTIEADRFEEMAREFSVEQGLSDPDQFFEEVERSNVVKRVGDYCEFAHRSFLDYFVASDLHRSSPDTTELLRRLVDLYFNPRWTEVTFFYVGIKRDADPALLEAIFDRPDGSLPVSVMKLLAGRLLQAGWLAKLEVRERATERAIEMAPTTRDVMLDALSRGADRPADVLGDALLLMIGKMSFGSTMLKPSNDRVLDRLLEDATADNILRALMIVGGLRDKVEKQELADVVGRMLDAMQHAKLDAASEMRLLAVLGGVEDGSEKTRKYVERRLKRLVGRNQDLAKTLFLSSGEKRRKRLGARRKGTE